MVMSLKSNLIIFLYFQLDVINEWIDRIRDSTQHHSMSPSYTTQSRIQPIPVSSLPLQNERVDNYPNRLQKLSNQIFQPKSPKKTIFNHLAGKKHRNGYFKFYKLDMRVERNIDNTLLTKIFLIGISLPPR